MLYGKYGAFGAFTATQTNEKRVTGWSRSRPGGQWKLSLPCSIEHPTALPPTAQHTARTQHQSVRSRASKVSTSTSILASVFCACHLCGHPPRSNTSKKWGETQQAGTILGMGVHRYRKTCFPIMYFLSPSPSGRYGVRGVFLP